jgi:hypothetical protein
MSNDNTQNESISYCIDEIENENNDTELDNIQCFLDVLNEPFSDDLVFPKMLNYDENFTVKDLLLICEYYGFAKQLKNNKNNKFNKEEIIRFLVYFESDIINDDIVNKRQNMWFYMGQLKNDKFMKKYVLW